MRIAYVCMDRGVPVFGCKGASIHVQEIIRALLARGADIELFAAQLGDDSPPALEAVRVHHLPVLFHADRAVRERAAFAANSDLRAALERERPFDLVYERYSLWSFAGMEYARDTRTPSVLEVNAPLIEEQALHRGLCDHARAEQVRERVFADAGVLVAVSEAVAAYLERHPTTRGRVHVIPNGISPDRFPAGLEPSCPCGPDTLTAGFVGSLKPWHGLPILIEAFALLHARYPRSRLLIVGDGPERAKLEADAAAHGVTEAVHYTGAVAPSKVPGLVASMDVAVAPYPKLKDFYFSPLKVFEYMAAGIAVVASRMGQLTQVIRDGVNGILCPPGDAHALAAAMERLRCDPGLRARLGQAARASVLRDYTWDAAAERILRLADAAADRLSPLAHR
jgi:glycosyltransferase involved in cell wall biosynthesis